MQMQSNCSHEFAVFSMLNNKLAGIAYFSRQMGQEGFTPMISGSFFTSESRKANRHELVREANRKTLRYELEKLLQRLSG